MRFREPATMRTSARLSPTGFTLAAMCLGTFMAILDTSLVNLGLHAIGASLHADMAVLQWVIDAYNLVYATLILTGGALGDLFGRRLIFVAGCALFAAGSLICALAPDATVLILGRGVAGLGAALELPTALAILNVTYPDPAARTRAIGIWGAMNGLAMAIGPTLGGLLVDAFGWRSLFWVILPVGAGTIALSLAQVQETSDPAGRRLDIVGQALSAAALGTLALGFIEGPAQGLRSPMVIGCGVSFLISLGLFLFVEQRSPDPLVPLSTFRNRPFSASVLDATLMTFAVYGLLFVLPLFFQGVQGSSAITAGIKLLPLSLVFFAVSLLAGKLATALGPRALIGSGMAAMGVGFVGVASAAAHTGYGVIAGSLVAIGLGLGLITGPIATVAVANAPTARSGMASGLVNMGRLVGATLGVAVLGALFGAQAETAVADVPAFMAGLHLTFLIGALAAITGAFIAFLWLRSDSLGARAGIAQSSNADTVGTR